MTIQTLQVGPIMTNCYLLCDEDAKVCALIDPGDDESRIEKLVGQSGCALKYILLTHGHFDHTSAVRPLLERYPDVPVYIHEKDSVTGRAASCCSPGWTSSTSGIIRRATCCPWAGCPCGSWKHRATPRAPCVCCWTGST